ncbi:MAG: ion transporter [Candidatus Neomarinimicrobiota bacterium]|nr:ion transporter [Candidatus Neomarinimicrobiota bacterium]
MSSIKERIKIMIFGTDTPGGKLFDVVLIITIFLSIISVLLDSVNEYHQKYGYILRVAEWIFTIMFTIEYFLRIYCIRKPVSYIFSFFGIIDLLAVLPTYISLFIPGTEVLQVIRVLRVLRVFRVLKLVQYIGEADLLVKALVASRRKIFVFLFSLMNIVVILGSIMYLIEGQSSGFTSIPRSIYWAIVTLTTVGYGDISPVTNLGQAIAAVIMIMGYSIIAVPTGIVTSEINFVLKKTKKRDCIVCGKEGFDEEAKFCSTCGSILTAKR